MVERHWRVLSRGFAVVGALPLVLFASFSLAAEVPRLVVDDPCWVWGQSGGTLRVGSPPCEHAAGGTSETKASAITRLLLIQGSMLGSAALALIGSFASRRRLCAAAFMVALVISVPLMLSGLGLITLLSACCFLGACYAMRPRAT